MTDQHLEDKDVFADYMRHITEHACDRTHCKIAERLAMKALIAREQDWGFPDQETKDD